MSGAAKSGNGREQDTHEQTIGHARSPELRRRNVQNDLNSGNLCRFGGSAQDLPSVCGQSDRWYCDRDTNSDEPERIAGELANSICKCTSSTNSVGGHVQVTPRFALSAPVNSFVNVTVLTSK